MSHIRAAEDDLNINLEVYVKGRYRVILMFNCARYPSKAQATRTASCKISVFAFKLLYIIKPT